MERAPRFWHVRCTARSLSAIRCDRSEPPSFAIGKHLVQDHDWEFQRQIALPKRAMLTGVARQSEWSYGGHPDGSRAKSHNRLVNLIKPNIA